ncbi:MAG: hypothetical protein CBB87_09930 [Micavibrio sp. TMED27]|nr:hypothetical protein [Micavibrio sp.]OUT90262.1 MAG: hypothetical protein CBB87_09930 [Micavibrio sp. TMED27]|tara:strand:+ start:505 stop:1215 length:711 start_codon:yes stop_codon:yes gene_type:complete
MKIITLSQKPKAVLFDLSGTLINSLHRGDRDVLDEICYKYSGQPYLEVRKKKDHSKSLRHNFNRFFDGEGSKAYHEYIEKLTAAIPLSPVFNGVAETLAALKEQQTRLAVVSNRPRSYISTALDYHDLRDTFDSVISSDKFPGIEKPAPEVIQYALEELDLPSVNGDHVVMVGDTSVDIECADNADVIPILFSDKERNTERVQERLRNPDKKPVILASNYSDLRKILVEPFKKMEL